TSVKPCAANHARSAPSRRDRTARNGRRSAKTPRSHQGEGSVTPASCAYLLRSGAPGKYWRSPSGSVWCASKTPGRRPFAPIEEFHPVKVIASSVRKGNILEIDDKLYVVLTAESFHPGKGTPTTQIDMRRISDGVKTTQRYKTTDQVERAHVED